MLDLDFANTVADDSPEAFAPEDAAPDPEALLAWLSSPVTLERMQAARAFCEVQDPRAPALLLPLLTDDCTLVRVSAAYALGRNPTPELVPVAIARLAAEWNGYVRKGLVWALGNCGDHPVRSRAIAAIIAALEREDLGLQEDARATLRKLGDPQGLAVLEKIDMEQGYCDLY
ncbi:MAG: HEAT repeat domain-containing protein [Pseudanabaenaceae cyanobacterium]